MSLKKVYLTQFSIIAEDQFLLLPYSVGLLWSYAKTIPEILHNYSLEEILFVKQPIDMIMNTIVDPDVMGFSTYE